MNCSDEMKLVECSVTEFSFEHEPYTGKWEYQVEVQGSCNISDSATREGTLTLRVSITGKSGERKLMSLRATMLGRFSTDEPYEGKVFEKSCLEYGTSILYAILRTAIQSFSANAGMSPAISLPFICPRSISANRKAE
jgi:preprotein translocase subunit SecB